MLRIHFSLRPRFIHLVWRMLKIVLDVFLSSSVSYLDIFVCVGWIMIERRDEKKVITNNSYVEQYFWYCYEISNRTVFALISSECSPQN